MAATFHCSVVTPERAVLETGTKQPEAIALYTSSGYTEIPHFGVYKNEPESRCFGKELTSV